MEAQLADISGSNEPECLTTCATTPRKMKSSETVMKSILPCALVLVLTAWLPAADHLPQLITVQAKFIESSKATIPHDLAKLTQQRGVDLLCAPSVSTRRGHQAEIQILREHQPPSISTRGFRPVPVGITIRVTPDIKDGIIAYTAQLTIRELITGTGQDDQPYASRMANAGIIVATKGAQTSSEILSRDLYVSGRSRDGEAVWFDFVEPRNGKKMVVWLRLQRV